MSKTNIIWVCACWASLFGSISHAKASPTTRPALKSASAVRSRGRVFVNMDTLKALLRQRGKRSVAQIFVSSAEYTGKISKDLLKLHGKLVFSSPQKESFLFDLGGQGGFIHGVRVNGRPRAPTIRPNGRYAIPLQAGDVSLEYALQLKHRPLRGEHRVQLGLPNIPRIRLKMDLVGKDWEVRTAPASAIKTNISNGRTSVNIVLPSMQDCSLIWKGQRIERKEQTRFRVQTNSLITLQEGLLLGNIDIQLQLLTGSMRSLLLKIPAQVEILHIGGDGVAEWFETKKDANWRHLTLQFSRAIHKQQSLNIRYERANLTSKVPISLPSVEVPGAEQYAGFIGVLAQADTEVTHHNATGAQIIDVRSLSGKFKAKGDRPVLLAYELNGQKSHITVRMIKHPWLKVLNTVVNRAQFETVRTRQGREMTKATYWVTNNRRQFMPIALPKGTRLISAFVAGRPVQPARKGKKEARYLLPLVRSRGHQVRQVFAVEILYTQKSQHLGHWGSFRSTLPSTPLEVLHYTWRYYVPRSHRVIWSSGTARRKWQHRFFRHLERRMIEDLKAGTPKAEAGTNFKRMNVYSTRGLKERFARRYYPSVSPKSAALGSISGLYDNRRGVYHSRFAKTQQQLRATLPLVGRLLTFRGHLLKGTAPTIKLTYIKHSWSALWYWFVLLGCSLLSFLFLTGLFHRDGVRWARLVGIVVLCGTFFALGFLLPLTYLAGFRGLMYGFWMTCLFGLSLVPTDRPTDKTFYVRMARWWAVAMTFGLLLVDGLGFQIATLFFAIPSYPALLRLRRPKETLFESTDPPPLPDNIEESDRAEDTQEEQGGAA